MMFDPTIFDNMKVVLEGTVYDHDLAGRILVIDRSDTVDLATFARVYSLRFHERGKTQANGVDANSGHNVIASADADLSGGHGDKDVKTAVAVEAVVVLRTGLQDLAGELLAVKGSNPGCEILVRFETAISSDQVCADVERTMREIWGSDIQLSQSLRYEYGGRTSLLQLTATLDFGRKINEDQLEDFANLIEHVIKTLQALKL